MTYPLIYLASQSPRRQQLLAQIGVPFEVLLPEDTLVAEALEAVLPGETALAYVKRVTVLKLQAARAQLKASRQVVHPILCADTTVALNGEILGKPQDHDDASRMLHRLAGQTHWVLTAIAVSEGRRTHRAVSRSKVTFAPMTRAHIQAYVDSGEPMGKAGAYAIQGQASTFVKSIQGSYSGIMGLPLFETATLLHKIAEA
jgi:septum formation protein